MKKLITIFLFITTVFAANAQEQKSEKEKAVALIKEYYSKKDSISDRSVDSQDFVMKNYKNFKIEFSNDNTVMTFSYNYKFEYASITTYVNDHYTFKNKIVVDFSKIENITLKSIDALKNQKQVYLLNFKAKPGYKIEQYTSEKDGKLPEIPKKVEEALVPVSTNCCDDRDYQEINNKIMQTFNELRKLCETN
ncbi:hypothetical protein SAMN05443549_10178 [Flavobacterium fluvii]|uniref:DUF4468 domain-containing protein n=1 Tax=Flavobacterium fluvii TaxID=468056 RepID=A0A1M5DUX2_9FLAO|nr:hypothetical protein [Flavobacterium fluvii]SHF70612.1 hypothetical protein SAMN05443549_10178 [Flavobacterium fluvii]